MDAIETIESPEVGGTRVGGLCAEDTAADKAEAAVAGDRGWAAFGVLDKGGGVVDDERGVNEDEVGVELLFSLIWLSITLFVSVESVEEVVGGVDEADDVATLTFERHISKADEALRLTSLADSRDEIGQTSIEILRAPPADKSCN